MSRLELVLDAHALNGESPTWAAREQKLYWIDTEEPALHRFDPASGTDEHWKMPSEIGAFALGNDGSIVAALRTGLMGINLDRQHSEMLVSPPYDPLTHRFNDGKCDSRGRFWVGTMMKPLDGAKPGADAQPTPLFVYDGALLRASGAAAVIANGIAWSPDGRTLYFSDSHARTVRSYDFDPERGEVSHQRDFACFSKGVPDGAAVDVEGCYWAANYDGGRVIRFDPDGRIEREVKLPVSEPTMCAFGGSDMRDLYITSASSGLAPDARARERHAGAIFRYRAPVAGLRVAGFAAAN
jgi:sugar lactone lactonase YvrE